MGFRHGDQEHEASRRMKTQLLVELDGLTRGEDHVFLLAASNMPWELDPAMLRRLEKRILVPLPNTDSRIKMLEINLPAVLCDLESSGQLIKTNLCYKELAEKCEGYSGSDLQIVCREAAMSCLRKIFHVLEDNTGNESSLAEFKFETIEMEDVIAVIQRTNPTQNDNEKYIDWHKRYGSV